MRRRLIEFIQIKKTVSAVDLARAFRISPANARHHLAALEEDGVVRIVDTRTQGRGRPTQFYGLTAELYRTNLEPFAKAVLGELLGDLSYKEREAVLERIACQLLENDSIPDGSLTHRITRAIRKLNDMNYQARWEAHLTAPRILLTHCPYASVVDQHSEICRMDAILLEKLLGLPVKLISKPGNLEDGESHCVFRLVLPEGG